MLLRCVVTCVAAASMTACGPGPTTEPAANPSRARPSPTAKSEKAPEPAPRSVVAKAQFRSETADMLRLWSDGRLEIGTQDAPEHWEPMEDIDDGIGLASNSRQACVLHKEGKATCWYGKDWRAQSWSPAVGGGRQIVARKADVCVLLADAVTCVQAPTNEDSLRARRAKRRILAAERRGTPLPTPAAETTSPTSTTIALPDVVRIVPNGSGPHGVITRDGRLLVGLDELEQVDALPPISDAVMLGRRDFCAVDRSARAWCSSRSRAPTGPRLVEGVLDVAQLEAFVDPEVDTEPGFTACARTHAGTVACWGSNRLGRIGVGPWGEFVSSRTARQVPVPVATTLSIDEGWVCVDTNSEGRWCWGDGRKSPAWSPSEDPVVLDANPVDEIAAGPKTLCVRRDREVECSTVPSVGRLVTVSGLPPAASFVEDEYEVCARTVRGDTVCWDDDGGRRSEASPRTPPGPDLRRGLQWGPSEIAEVVVATGTEGLGEHPCARSNAGQVRCARGVHRFGGEGKRWPLVELSEPAEQLVVIGEGGCARLRSGRVACWGEAAALGTGHPTAVPRPVKVGSPWPALPPPEHFGPGS